MQTSGEAMYMVFDLEPKGKYNVTDRVCPVCDIFTSEDHGPRIGDDWIPGAVACLTAKTRKLLINLREFEFIRHEKYNLPEWRLKALEKEMHDIIDAILDKDALRTRQIAVKEKNRE